MATPIESLLKENLTFNTTNYQPRQLIKADNLTEAVIQVVEARRKHLSRQKFWLIGLMGFPVLLYLSAVIAVGGLPGREDTASMASGLMAFPWIIALIMKVDQSIDNAYALARLENIATMWLMEGSDKVESPELLMDLLTPTVVAGGKPWRKMPREKVLA